MQVGAIARGLQDLDNLLPVQILVLCSLGLQVILLLCAGVRRTKTSIVVPVPLQMLFLWLAYNLGGSFATYTLARLSFSNVAGNHPLVALWAPFVLLHLAGPDNIAAYALQDNQLWLRSLYTFFSQVTAGGSFLYTYRNSSGNFLRLDSQLMFVVAVVKYWERWLALQRGNLSSIRDSLKKQSPAIYSHVHPQDVKLKERVGSENGSKRLDEESHLRRAHTLFHICKCAIVGSSEDKPGKQNYMSRFDNVEYWTLVEIELSLMYDILYTKAAVIHTWHGYSIRVISPLAILTSLLLFHFSGEDRHRTVDTAMTYVLFGGAFFMESTSLLHTLGSSWTYASLIATRCSWLRYKVLCTKRWDWIRKKVVSLSCLVSCGRSRYQGRRWSGNMGQYNMLHFCTRANTLLTRPLLGSLAMLVGLEELWNRKHFSGTINISDHILIKVYINKHTDLLYTSNWINTLGMVKHSWGMATLSCRKLKGKFEDTLGHEFQEGITIWHVATEFFLAECNSANPEDRDLLKAIKALSNYMMFLLVDRPYMLPGIAQHKLYERTCKLLEGVEHRKKGICAMLKSFFRWHDDPPGFTYRASDSKILADLYSTYRGQKFSYKTVRLTYSARVAEKLLEFKRDKGPTESLKLLLELWTDMLIYAGNKCSRESHAKELSSGGELITVVWLMLEHFHQLALESDEEASAEEATSKEEYPDNYRV